MPSGPGLERRGEPTAGPTPTIYLEPEEAERQKELRMRPVHVRVVPAVRVAGFAS